MKKTLTKTIQYLLLTTLLALSFIPLSAKNIEDGLDEEEAINIPLIYEQSTEGPVVRFPVLIPVEASLFSTNGIVRLVFSWPIEGLTARLSNLTSGDLSSFDVSSVETIFLPVLFGFGLYNLEFFNSAGELLYHGLFYFCPNIY